MSSAPRDEKVEIPASRSDNSLSGCSLGKAEKFPDFADATNQRVKETCDQCKRSWHVLTVIRFVFAHFGLVIDEKSDASLLKEFDAVHRYDEQELLLAYLKYKCAASFAWFLQDEMPVLPNELGAKGVRATPFWAGGRYYSFMIGERVRGNTQFFYSLLMMKKGFPRPSGEDCDKAAEKACLTMTTEVPQSDRRNVAIDVVGEYCRRIIKQCFRPVAWNDEMPSWWSMSGHYGAKSSDGGALEVIRALGFSPDSREFVLERYYDGRHEEAMEDEESPQFTLTSGAQAELRRCQRNLVAAGLEEQSRCKPVALPEPLKIRIVTVGPVFRYAACGVIQKRIWSQLKSDSHFAIGSPIDSAQLMRTLGRRELGHKWVSGDYKAATDNLSIELSEHIANQIADVTDMPWEYRQLFVEALVAHEYEMPDGSFAPQRRGQLMGSPVSFPVLCIANAALIWASVFPAERKLRDTKFLVNGDDCVFQSTQESYLAWKEIASLVGLEVSVGKTYFSEDVLVMNSTLFVDTDGIFTEVPYLNLGLLIGLKRSGSDHARDVVPSKKNGWVVDMGVGGRARAYTKGWGQRAAGMLGEFIRVNRDQLDLFGSRPWFISEEFGGFGLPETGHVDHRPSMEDMSAVIRMDHHRTAHGTVTVKPKTVQELDSPFHRACEKALADRFGLSVRRNARFQAGAYQWSVMKDTPLEKNPRWLAERNSINAARDVRAFWRKAWKHGGESAEIVRAWAEDQEFDMENVSLEGLTRQYYDRLLVIGPNGNVPKVLIRMDFLDERAEPLMVRNAGALAVEVDGVLQARLVLH